MERIAIYPGSFDPPTYGHLDIIERASRLCDELIIGVLKNSAKTPLFSVDERVNMLKVTTSDIKNVRVMSFQGLTVDFARQNKASIIVRGLRALTDFDYELQLSQINKTLCEDIETIFLSTNLKYSFLSSSTVKEVASYRADISGLVPPYIQDLVEKKLKEIQQQ
ncbi:MAG TPA: pantetheine-phosphate adenylyltransferase [Candidatus Avilachnospira avicola]|nr:pantetheine-phosphate adenylyltransferase [Candidatus Avilachnospira avicola]